MLIARLFGPLELVADGRRLGPRDLDGHKPRRLLEILLVERGHVVSKERLADLLWRGHTGPRRGDARHVRVHASAPARPGPRGPAVTSSAVVAGC